MTSRSFLLALPLALLAGCGPSRFSDSDITRLCALQIRCGSTTTQSTCESLVRAARDGASTRSCSGSFGAAGRCIVRADSCSASVCTDEQARLDECLNDEPTTPQSDAGRRTDARVTMTGDEGAVRQSSGYLEIFHDGEWRGICDDSFTATNAQVVCRQLGMSGTGEFIGSIAGSDSFWLDDVSCSGIEFEISECSSSGWGVDNCGASEHVLVTCAR